MEVSSFFYIAVTTLILITVTMVSVMNFPFNWVFYLTVLGQVFVVIMVYKVLRDNHKMNKTPLIIFMKIV
jgi:uncharacterized membrane protein